MLLNNAAKSSAWATTCPIVLALVAELFNYGRKTICRSESLPAWLLLAVD
jgi:hypothetical protein